MGGTMCTPEEDRNLTHGGRGAMEMCSWEPAVPSQGTGESLYLQSSCRHG